jgi:pyruvate/2-oxoglutarate dehydrogenase complex dihydrolipoamide acyltransferase (E2) component
MKLRIAAVFVTAFALSACSDADWSNSMSFAGLDDSDQAAAQPAAQAAPQPVAQVTPPPGAQPAPAQTAQAITANPFCSAVARQDAERNDFDAATQQGVYVRSYQQCVTIFGNSAPE